MGRNMIRNAGLWEYAECFGEEMKSAAHARRNEGIRLGIDHRWKGQGAFLRMSLKPKRETIMTRKILLLASGALIVALVSANSILNTQPAKAAANSVANARAAQPEIGSGPAEASLPGRTSIDSCDIPVKIKGVKVTPVAGRAGNNNVSVEWEVSELPRSVAIDSFNVIAMMARNGARGELTVNGRTRRATLKVIGKDDGGDCIVTVTARGHATVTGTNQVKGRFWAR